MIFRKVLIAMTATAIAVAVGACKHENFTNASFNSIPNSGWAYGDTLSFDIPHPDSIATGKLAVVVRHTDNYQYSNLWLELTTPLDSTSTRVDTINFQLADIYGKWHGNGVGTSFTTIDTLDDSYRFERHRPAMLRHIMRSDTIRHIEQIGLILIQ